MMRSAAIALAAGLSLSRHLRHLPAIRSNPISPQRRRPPVSISPARSRASDRAADGPGRDVAPVPRRPLHLITEPAKVFDNLYFVGTKFHSSWALTTSDGIILIDTLYEYDFRRGDRRRLEEARAQSRQRQYVIISHAHGDHIGGAKLMQDRFHSRIVMAAPDWEGVEKSAKSISHGKPKRDIVGADGQVITLGDTSVTLVFTPGHTRERCR